MPAKQKSEKDYDDIPGTYVFDADRSRRGYHLNMFCMSLMKAENRKAFKDNEPKYLDERFPQLTPEQREAILKRQARGERRPPVPASCRADDRLDPAGLRRHDAARRPPGRRQPLEIGPVQQCWIKHRQGG